MTATDISYTDAEWAARKKLLAEAAGSLEQRIVANHGRTASVRIVPSRMLSIAVNIQVRGVPSPTQWELLYRYIVTETRAVTGGVNSDTENRLGDRLMRYSVSPENPVSVSRQNELMRDFWTRQLGQATALKPIHASFYFPYTPTRTGAQG
ncbi:hypothetical protein HYV82_06710 [Candidatus Woesearchaeota archaeon]|nr:hypothetical protein [Candidatus Woesearchaeota archaeon]